VTWSLAFIWTLALELPIYALAARGRLARAPFFLAFFLGNSFTHPLVWYFWPRFDDYDSAFRALEAFAFTSEALIFAIAFRFAALDPAHRTVARALLFGAIASTLANAFSAFAGPWILDALPHG
jgi:hypothetical protein